MTVEVTCFVDTNVLIYALDAADPKSAITERLIEHRPTLSVQVINVNGDLNPRKHGGGFF